MKQTTNIERWRSDSARPGEDNTMIEENSKPFPPAVNFHFMKACNMNCRFCFARFLGVRPVNREIAEHLSRMLAERFDKITFVGGEPTLCPWLPDLLRTAKAHGATTMVVTNGSLLTREYLSSLKDVLDWIGLSVDSERSETNIRHGRSVRGVPVAARRYVSIADWARERGIRLKVNVVVSAFNVQEDLSELLALMRPDRVKIMRILPIGGQNDGIVEPLLVSDEAFRRYAERHRHLGSAVTTLAIEDTEDIRGSYAMVDPAGRFFDNTRGYHTYSAPICEVGVQRAWQQVSFSAAAFARRGGHYAWSEPGRLGGCRKDCQNHAVATVSTVAV